MAKIELTLAERAQALVYALRVLKACRAGRNRRLTPGQSASFGWLDAEFALITRLAHVNRCLAYKARHG